MSDFFDLLDDLNIQQTISNLSPLKQRVALALVNGDNFHQIGIREGLKTSKVYKLKDELQADLLWLKKECRWNEEKNYEDLLFEKIIPNVSKMKLSEFVNLYLRDYSDIDFNSVKEWEDCKVIKDRMIVVICLIVRELFIRNKPMVIDYHYSNRKSLVSLIQTFKVVVRSSFIIHDRLKVLHTDADLGIRLKDTSQVRTIWTQGRQPNEAGTIVIFDENNSVIERNIPKISYL